MLEQVETSGLVGMESISYGCNTDLNLGWVQGQNVMPLLFIPFPHSNVEAATVNVMVFYLRETPHR